MEIEEKGFGNGQDPRYPVSRMDAILIAQGHEPTLSVRSSNESISRALRHLCKTPAMVVTACNQGIPLSFPPETVPGSRPLCFTTFFFLAESTLHYVNAAKRALNGDDSMDIPRLWRNLGDKHVIKFALEKIAFFNLTEASRALNLAQARTKLAFTTFVESAQARIETRRQAAEVMRQEAAAQAATAAAEAAEVARVAAEAAAAQAATAAAEAAEVARVAAEAAAAAEEAAAREAHISGAHLRKWPLFPQAAEVRSPDNDWRQIDHLPTKSLFKSSGPLIINIPQKHTASYCIMKADIMHLYKAASSDEERDRALKWWVACDQLMLRPEQKSRGVGRSGYDTVDRRFQAYADGDFILLVSLFEKSREAARPRRYTPPSEENKMGRAWKLIQKRHLSKGVKAMTSGNIADLKNPLVKAQMERKLGAKRAFELPGSLEDNGRPFEPVAVDLKEAFKHLPNMAGKGPDQTANEHLKCCSNNYEDPSAAEGMTAHNFFANLYLNNGLPPWFYSGSVISTLLPIVKPNVQVAEGEEVDARPVLIGSCWPRAAIAAAVKERSEDAEKHFYPIQVSCGVPHGGLSLATACKLHLETYPDHVLGSLDVINAFPSSWVAMMLKAFEQAPERLRQLTPLAFCTLSPAAEIIGLAIAQEEGGRTGEPLISLGFCLMIHPHLVWANEEMEKVNGAVKAQTDDIRLLGPLEDVLRVAVELGVRLKRECGLDLAETKCNVVGQNADDIRATIASVPAYADLFKIACFDKETAGVIQWGEGIGAKVSGVPVGDVAFLDNWMTREVLLVGAKIDKICDMLHIWSLQGLHCVGASCLQSLVQHLMQSIPPAVIAPYVE